jgi:hypothetical protein
MIGRCSEVGFWGLCTMITYDIFGAQPNRLENLLGIWQIRGSKTICLGPITSLADVAE